MKVLSRLKVQYDVRKVLSFTESLQIVASQVFGGKKGSSPKGPVNEVTDLASFNWAQYA